MKRDPCPSEASCSGPKCTNGTLVSYSGTGILERIVGRPVEDIAAQWSELQPYLLDLGEKALATVEHRRP